MANLEVPIKIRTRDCMVNGRPGYFHTWEQYSEVMPPSPLVGGHPGGTIARVVGIVEFPDGVRRVNPYDIEFVDEEHANLVEYEKWLKEKGESNVR